MTTATRPRPTVKRECRNCRRALLRLWPQTVAVVSPRGLEHAGELDGGRTRCGRDATTDGWWWPA